MKIGKQIKSVVSSLNSSKYFAGICMIMLNIGSKYVTIKLSKSQEDILRNGLARQLLIFSITWIGTRDIYASLVITALFVIMTQFMFNENSRFCILPDKIKKIYQHIDQNNDDKISEEELESAMNVLKKAKNVST